MSKIVDKNEINNLLKNTANGDVDSAKKLYELMRPPIFSHIYKRVRSKQIAEDLLHNVFLNLLKRVKNTMFFINGFGYIFRMTDREINHYLKTKYKSVVVDVEMDYIKSDFDLEEDFDFKYLFNVLTAEEKSYIKLKAEGYTLDEISEKQNVSKSTVKRRINEIIEKLRRSIKWTKN